MPADSSLITFRVSPEDHDLLRAVAHYSAESVSAFVRESALASARQVLADVGADTVMEGVRTQELQRHSDVQRRLEDRLAYLRSQAGGPERE